MKLKASICILFISVFFECAAQKPYYNKKESDWQEMKIPDLPVKYTVYLLGDPGEDASGAAFNLVKQSIPESDTAHAIVFFGNATDHHTEKKKSGDERKLEIASQLRDDKGTLIFIPDPDTKIKKAAEVKKYLEKKLQGK